jgi:glycine/D-amino acid oxidase-like deaminating enzyme
MGIQTFQKGEVEKINVKNGQAESVDTTSVQFPIEVVLNAGAPWALKVHPFPEIPLPLRLSREQDCVFQAPAEFKNQPIVSDPILGVYSRSDVGGRLLAGLGIQKKKNLVTRTTWTKDQTRGLRTR